MKKTRRICVHEYGPPEVLKWEDIELPPPAENEVLVSHHAVGINYVEIYQRTGLYTLNLPSGIGTEAAGIIEAVGDGVSEFKIGDRVAYATGPLGSYAYHRNINSQFVVKIPDELSMVNSAALMLKGLTAQYLIRQTFPVKRNDWVLIYAAAGGVGLLLSQWANYLGAHVIGVVGSSEKSKWANEAGCQNVIVGYDKVSDAVRQITAGRGVDVVYDSVGKETFIQSIDSLRPRGMMVSFGNASGAVGPISVNMLAQKGSLFLTRPTLYGYAAMREDLTKMANELFQMVVNGHLTVKNINTLPIASVVEAHKLIAERKNIGATVLIREDNIKVDA